MLRRRILASAMASVMAIGSIAAVASAEDTAVATANVKTRDDLAAYVKSFDKFRETEIYDYGSLAGEDFLDALEYADNVLADSSATTIDYTVAYSMIDSVYTELLKHKYTADQLKDLIKKYQKDYDTNNILNDELGDNRWSPESFSEFENAFDDATAVASSSDSRIITDAYEVLEDKHGKLSALTAVTKKDFRTALKAYETALQKEFAYDSWRRGTIKNSGWQFDGKNFAYGLIYNYVASANGTINAKYEILDQIKELNTTTQTDIVDAYNDCVLATSVLNGFTADDTNRATKANVKTLMNTYHGRLVYDYNTTAARDLYAELVEKLGTDKVHNKTGDNYSYTIDKKKPALASTSSNIWYVTGDGKLNSAELTVKADVKYYIALDEDGFALGISTTGTKDVTPVTDWSGNNGFTGEVYELTEAKEFGGVTYPVGYRVIFKNDCIWKIHDTDWSTNCLTGLSVAELLKFADPVVDGFPNAKSFKLVNAGTTVDLTDYIDVTAADLAANEKSSSLNNRKGNGYFEAKDETENWTALKDVAHVKSATWDDDGEIINSSGDTVRTYVTLDNAFKVAENYLDAKNDDDFATSGIIVAGDDKREALDTISALDNKTLKGSSQEWTLVYRNLKYALSDKYDSTTCNHTKKDVEELIEKAYDLAEKTGDAALFEYNHNQLVDARQAALDWVKAANKIKTYKDNVTYVEVGSQSFIADKVYHKLKDYYDVLADEYENFKYSFGEIYDYINEVKTMIDDGKLTATDALVKKLADASYYLSTVESLVVVDSTTKDGTYSSEYTFNDNDAFTSDRMFQEFNRVFTFAKNDPDGYKFQYKANTWLKVKGVKDYSGNPNVNYTHFQLKTAYEDLILEVKSQLEPDVKIGDVNKDGKVDALDAAKILIAIAANETIDVKVGDYNADGAVNALDAAKILQDVAAGVLK